MSQNLRLNWLALCSLGFMCGGILHGAETMTLRAVGPRHYISANLNELDVSPDGTLLALALKEQGNKQSSPKIQILDANSMSPKIPLIDTGTDGYIPTIWFTADGKYVVSGSGYIFQIWDPRTGQKIGSCDRSVFVWHHGGHPSLPELITGSGNSQIRRWSVPTAERMGEWKTAFTSVLGTRFNAAGNRFVLVGQIKQQNSAKRTIQIWSYPDMKVLAEPLKNFECGRFTRLLRSPDQQGFVFCDAEGKCYAGQFSSSTIKHLQAKLPSGQPFRPVQDVGYLDTQRLLLQSWGQFCILDLQTGTSTAIVCDETRGSGSVVLPGTDLVIASGEDAEGRRFVSRWEVTRADEKTPSSVGGQIAGGMSDIAANTTPAVPEASALQESPPADQQAAAEKVIRQLLGDPLEAGSSAELAERLFRLADGEKDDTNRYVMLVMAAKMAIEHGEAPLGKSVFRRMEEQFRCDGLKLAGGFLFEAKNQRLASDKKRQMAQWAEDLGDRAIADDRLGFASAFYDMAIGWSIRDIANGRRRRIKAAELDKILPAFREAEAARKRLATNPEDPRANLIWGQFLCMRRGKWAEGLRHLEKGKDPLLQEIASLDLRTSNDDPVALLEVARRWKAYGEEQDDPVRRAGALEASRFWYQRAVAQLDGLSKLSAETELGKLPPSSPSISPLRKQ